MIKRLSIITVLVFMGFIAYGQAALAEPVPPVTECPCDLQIVGNVGGLSGNEIIDMVCPGGELSDGADSLFTQDEVSVSANDPIKRYSVFDTTEGRDRFRCELQFGEFILNAGLIPAEYEICRESLIRRCNLKQLRPIPTMSEWGMIATAGALGLFGLYTIRRRRATA